VTSTIPVIGARTTAVKNAAMPMLASVHKILRFCDLCKEPGIFPFLRV
jgi:hypothetical protein